MLYIKTIADNKNDAAILYFKYRVRWIFNLPVRIHIENIHISLDLLLS